MSVAMEDDRPITRPVTLNEAAALVRVSPSTLRRWAATGLLPTVLWRGRRYAREVDVLNVDRDQRRKAALRSGGDRRATPVWELIDKRAMHS